MYQNYPNPFNPTTVISFNLDNAQETSLEIYNDKGQNIKTLISNRLDAGSYAFRWNGTDAQGKEVSSGIYLYKLETSSYIKVNKMILLK